MFQESGFVFDFSNSSIKDTIKQAIQNANQDILKILKQGKFKFTSDNFSDKDAEFLALAVLSDNVDLIQALKEAGVNLNHEQVVDGLSNLSPLITSILCNKYRVIEALLQCEVNQEPLKVDLNQINLEDFASGITNEVALEFREQVKQAICQFAEKNKQEDNTLSISPSQLITLMHRPTLSIEKSIENTKVFREQLSLG